MNIFEGVSEAYPEIAPASLSADYTELSECKSIYKNNPPWKKVKKSGLSANGERPMALLNTGKVLCDEFSALSFSEQVDITVNDETAQSYVLDTLNANGFWKNFSDFLSLSYAVGGGVLKVYADNNKPLIDYVNADNFIPTVWNSGGICEGIFTSHTVKGKYFYTLVERHFSENDTPCVENNLFRSESENSIGKEVDLSELYEDLKPLIKYDGITDTKMFHYFKPAVSNNVNADSPLGISVYSNAKDTLKALDIAFDSFSREFILGKKRIIVPSSCIKTIPDTETGEIVRYFDPNDEAFMALKCDETEDLKITDNTVELRIDEHVSAINAMLNILCFQTGLSAGTLSFSGAEGVKTATEVISRDSKTARTIKSNKNLLTETIEGLVKSIIAVGIFYEDLKNKDYEVTIGWQDNIIVDDDTLIDRNIKLVDAGLKSKIRAVMEVNKCDEETATKILEEISKEQNVTGLSVDNLFGGGENDKA